MYNTRSCFRYIALSLLLSVLAVVFMQMDVLANSEETAPGTGNELLVKYTKMPRSIAAVPVLPAATENAEYIAPSVDLLKFPEDADMGKIKQQLGDNPFVEAVEPNFKRKVMASVNDPYYPSQWWLPHVKADRLWMLAGQQRKSTVVAVIDSGIDGNHLEFAGRIAAGGFNFIDQNENLMDDHGHGTNVAGVIAAKSNNGLGITGVSGTYQVAVLPLKTVRKDGTATVADNVKAIDYAIQKRVDVINISQGGPAFSTFEQDAIKRAENAGILIVASAGNDALKGNPPMYPASYKEVISVGSVGKNNVRSDFSNYNDFVDIVAPGEQIHTTDRSNSYRSMYGTSFSAPVVAGTAAMMKAVVPEMTIQQATELLLHTASDLGAPGWDSHYGEGLVNMEKIAVKLANWTVPVTGVKLDKTAVTLTVNEKTSLSAAVMPEHATNKKLIWSTSNPEIVEVGQTGEVTATGEGSATVTAMTEEGQFKANVGITVHSPVPFAGDFPDMNIEDTKIFSVRFNKALDEKFPYSRHIFISKSADGQGELFTSYQARINPGNPSQLYISPSAKWEQGTFYLIIKKEVSGADGKSLGKDVKVRFTVR